MLFATFTIILVSSKTCSFCERIWYVIVLVKSKTFAPETCFFLSIKAVALYSVLNCGVKFLISVPWGNKNSKVSSSLSVVAFLNILLLIGIIPWKLKSPKLTLSDKVSFDNTKDWKTLPILSSILKVACCLASTTASKSVEYILKSNVSPFIFAYTVKYATYLSAEAT